MKDLEKRNYFIVELNKESGKNPNQIIKLLGYTEDLPKENNSFVLIGEGRISGAVRLIKTSPIVEVYSESNTKMTFKTENSLYSLTVLQELAHTLSDNLAKDYVSIGNDRIDAYMRKLEIFIQDLSKVPTVSLQDNVSDGETKIDDFMLKLDTLETRTIQ
jgi:hypothetical protein